MCVATTGRSCVCRVHLHGSSRHSTARTSRNPATSWSSGLWERHISINSEAAFKRCTLMQSGVSSSPDSSSSLRLCQQACGGWAKYLISKKLAIVYLVLRYQYVPHGRASQERASQPRPSATVARQATLPSSYASGRHAARGQSHSGWSAGSARFCRSEQEHTWFAVVFSACLLSELVRMLAGDDVNTRNKLKHSKAGGG